MIIYDHEKHGDGDDHETNLGNAVQLSGCKHVIPCLRVADHDDADHDDHDDDHDHADEYDNHDDLTSNLCNASPALAVLTDSVIWFAGRLCHRLNLNDNYKIIFIIILSFL